MLSLKSYNNGIAVVQIFWGLWLLPLGCFGYLTVFLTNMLFPEITIPSVVSKPASIGEIGTCLWLLILGNKPIKILEKG